jgi:hypothetical protein
MTATVKIKSHAGMTWGLLFAVVFSMMWATCWPTYTEPRAGTGLASHIQLPDPEAIKQAFMAARVELLSLRDRMPIMLRGLDSPAKVPDYRAEWEAQRAGEAARLDAVERIADPRMLPIVKAMRTELADYDAAYTRILAFVETGGSTMSGDAERTFRAWMRHTVFSRPTMPQERAQAG